MSRKGPERIETARLVVRRPTVDDCGTMFGRYASDPEVVKYVGWPRFEREATLRRYVEFPNLEGGRVCDVFCYARVRPGGCRFPAPADDQRAR